ncbi:uncharacterized protein [Drosophila tropicalis]|uniref:uncharacterized protein n=1 Tax=Drosophila tropicalis TaxID=46794 RepID=UPI0035ABDFD4
MGMDFREINKFDWRFQLNNNNNLIDYSAVNTYNSSDVALDKQEDQHHRLRHRQSDEAAAATTTTTMGTKQKQAAAAALGEEDDGRGSAGGQKAEAAGAACATMEAEAEGGAVAAAATADKIGWPAGLPYFDLDRDGYGLAAAAAALTPTDIEEALAGAGVGGGGLSSSRTSLNNSTENLSYASDNYYGDDLILLDDDDDVEAEEISLNSDDCVYAYRGDRADFDISLEGALPSRGGIGMGIRSGMASGPGIGGNGRHLDVIIGRDDETEFLEMDFEPDPSSELELDGGMAAMPQANLLLMQRDFSQMSESRQLYSSPIDDYPPQEDVLQQQKQRLSKKFARISLNLDQIKDHTGVDLDLDMELRSGVNVDGVGLPEERHEELVPESLTQTAHSLPSSFSRSTSVPPNDTEPKLTGAKPKRLMSKSSSSSSKPRRSQNSSSFDERCFSCTDFRLGSNQQPAGSSASSTQQLDPTVAPMLVAAAAVVAMASSNSNHSSSSMAQFDLTNEQETTCLDCLEKEFLANTIGKALDLTSCAKCRRRGHAHKGSSLSLYNQTPRCRSGSPVFFDELSGGIYTNWPTAQAQVPPPSLPPPAAAPTYNQRFISCDNNFGGLPLLKPSFSTEPQSAPLVVVSARLSTSSSQLCDEEHLVQALDKLHISYDKTLLHLYFERAERDTHTVASIRPSSFDGNLKDLLLHVSKQQCNHRKLKKLIELVSQQQLNVQFKRTNEIKQAFVPVKVSDILDAWSRHRDLSVLRQLDNRFHQANVMGKIGHIVRQAAKASATVTSSSSTAASSSSTATVRRALPEFIMIPQYYACGELTLTRRC